MTKPKRRDLEARIVDLLAENADLRAMLDAERTAAKIRREAPPARSWRGRISDAIGNLLDAVGVGW